MLRIFTLMAVALLMLCCMHGHKTNAPITYLYVYDHSENDSYLLTDSLVVYRDLPFERSLELYKDSDTLAKQADQYLYLSIFELQKERFAVIADSATTNFYRYLPNGTYKKEYTIPVALGSRALLTKKTLTPMDIPMCCLPCRRVGFMAMTTCCCSITQKRIGWCTTTSLRS